VKNRYAYSIEDGLLCWFGYISYLIESVTRGEKSTNMRIAKVKQCFYDFYKYSHLDEIEKKKVDEYTWFMLVERSTG
jgi:hypothetical protein